MEFRLNKLVIAGFNFDFSALTSNTITHILEKDLGFTDTHSSPEREAIIRKLLIRLDSPNGLGIYKFNDNKRLLNEVRGYATHTIL